MSIDLRIAGTVSDSIVDGPGLRYTIFTQGCPHHCEGCHNPQTHDFNGGRVVDINSLYEEIIANKLLSGVTFSGGEPMAQPQPLLELARLIRANTSLNIMIYSGYTHEQLVAMNSPVINELLSLTYILVDGRYDQSLRNLELLYRGSSNQRVIYLRPQGE